ncbi:hypothetical protein JWG39_13790 [Desulforhopalus vacuolatus]|uniref:hypothetical protein n=1 Tax=Desulforhopalus vacuolatus TaxID=40414 RepID=UPI0019658681|nr:hypothetical protein [Desulforhopalus vacuolatus]MBM9520886.1 hypothetical protein [Desulforhopalus vacuolatus]
MLLDKAYLVSTKDHIIAGITVVLIFYQGGATATLSCIRDNYRFRQFRCGWQGRCC